MPFRNILVAVDGSEYSQRAAEYAFWLAGELDAEISAQHVVDPRLVELFIAPEFGEELGFSVAADTEDRVFRAIKKIGTVVLELFAKEAKERGIAVESHLDIGHIVEEVVKRSRTHDLVVMGHKGKGAKQSPSNLMTGSVAERVVLNSYSPVLVAVNSLKEIDQLLVAYDGSEAAKGALLAAEQMAKETHKTLRALTVVAEGESAAEAQITVEQGEPYLREFHDKDVFRIEKGPHAQTLMDYAEKSRSLLIMGAYGFKRVDEMVLGTTASQVVRNSPTSVLVFKHEGKAGKGGKKAASAGTAKKS
ncbi:MAG: universal stress protein [Candidatus Melainabacteria bacterium]|nr:universal stress protein [Candidatus Melainabacteria bacterium]